MKPRHYSLKSLFAASIYCVCSLPASLLAADKYWDSNGSATLGAGMTPTGNWGTSNFWNTDSAGGAGTFSTSIAATDTAIFSAGTDATGSPTITLNANTTVAGLTIEEGSPKFVSVTSVKNLTVNSNVTFARSIDFGASTATAVSLQLGSNTLTQTGGTFNTYGANSMGGAFLKGGNSFVGNASGFGTTGNVTIGDLAGSSSYSLNLRSNVTLARPIVLQSGGTLTASFLNASGNVSTVLSGGMTGSNAVVNVQSYVTSTGGTNATMTVSGAPLNFVGALKLANTDNNISPTPRSGLVTISAVIGANVTDVTATNLTRIGTTLAQTIVISGANAYSGNTTIASPTEATHTTLLQLGAANVIPDGVGHGNVSIQTGGILDINGKSETINGLSGSGVVDNSVGTGSLSIGANDQTSSFSGLIKNTAGTLAITKVGTGTLSLTTENTYSGTTTIGNGSGILEISHGAALGSGTVAITKAGTAEGMLSLTNDIIVMNNFTFNSANEFSSGGSAQIQNTSGNNILAGNLTLTNTGGNGINIESAAGTLTIEGTVSSNVTDQVRKLTLSGAANGEISGPIQDTNGYRFSVAKSGAGVWTLSGANTYSGTTSVKEGTLSIQSFGSLNDTATVEIASGAILNLDFIGTNTIEKLTFNGARQASGTWGKIGSLADHTDARITGNGMLLVAPLYFLWTDLAATQKWSTAGNWDINATPSSGKTLQFSATANPAITNDLAAGTSIASLNFDANAADYTIAGSNSLGITAGISNLSANNQTLLFPIEFEATIPINVSSAIMTLAGNLTGDFGFTKFGTGDLTLSGTNTYTGTTTVNAGYLVAVNAASLPAGTTLAFTNTTNPAQLDIVGLNQSLANMTFGTQTTGGNAVTIFGDSASSLTVSPASLIFGPAAAPVASNLTVSMATLGRFTYNNATGTFSLQAGSGAGSGITTVTLANTTNTITADTLKLSGLNGAAGNKSILNLGLHNTLHANTILLAANQGRGAATLQYAAGLDTGGSLEIRNALGTGAANITIGKNSSFSGDVNVYTSLIDTTGNAATLDAILGTLIIGNAHSDGATTRQVQSKGSLIMGAGTLTANSAVIGLLEGVATTGASKYTATGLLSLSAGGTANIGTITLANDGMATIGGINNLDGQINLEGSGGTTTLRATTIQQGIVVAGETSRIARINWTDGTLGNISGGDLGISDVAVLLVGGGNHTFDITPSQSATVSSAITSQSGSTPLTKTGGGTLILSGANTYVGQTTVAAGELQTTTAFLDDASGVEISTTGGGKLNLNFSGTDIVNALTFDAVPQATGTTYGATGSDATVIDDVHFSGTGKLQVGVISDPYAAWIGGFGLPVDKLGKTDDPDGDGISNLLEFALDGNPASGAASGKVVNKIDAGFFTLTLPVRAGAVFTGAGPLSSAPLEKLIYNIDGSTNLTSFTAGVEEITALSAGLPPLTSTDWTYRTFRLTTPVSVAPKGFLRAGAVAAP